MTRLRGWSLSDQSRLAARSSGIARHLRSDLSTLLPSVAFATAMLRSLMLMMLEKELLNWHIRWRSQVSRGVWEPTGRQREATLQDKKSATNGTKGQGDNGRQHSRTKIGHKRDQRPGRQRETILQDKKSATNGTKGGDHDILFWYTFIFSLVAESTQPVGKSRHTESAELLDRR